MFSLTSENLSNDPDLMQEAQQLATGLGGQLSLPKASWKFALIEKLSASGLQIIPNYTTIRPSVPC
jgi:hypothetical protein